MKGVRLGPGDVAVGKEQFGILIRFLRETWETARMYENPAISDGLTLLSKKNAEIDDLRAALEELVAAVGEMPENALGTVQGQRVNAAHSHACKVLGDDK